MKNILKPVLLIAFIILMSVNIACSGSSCSGKSCAAPSCSNREPSQPQHIHSFFDGTCPCGAIDPDYVPHEHLYVDGYCECGMIEREYAYLKAKHMATFYASEAIITATTSLNNHGNVLSGIIIKKVAKMDSFSKDEVATLGNIVNDLKISAGYIESAYKEMIVALAANTLITEDGSVVAYSTIKANFDNGALTLAEIAENKGVTVTVDDRPFSVDLEDSTLLPAITALQTTLSNLHNAHETYSALVAEDKESYTWAELRSILNYIMVFSNTKLNGQTIDASINTEELIKLIMEQGIYIVLESGAGIYVEIAEHCGNYSADVTATNLQVGGITFDLLLANMATESKQTPSFLEITLDEISVIQPPED